MSRASDRPTTRRKSGYEGDRQEIDQMKWLRNRVPVLSDLGIPQIIN